jgi:hypothetical protein
MDLFRHLETLTSTNDTLLAISCGIIDDAGTTTYSTTDILLWALGLTLNLSCNY